MFYSDPGNLSPTGLKGVDTNNGPHNKLLVLSAAEQEALLNFPGAAASNTGFAALVVFKADTSLQAAPRETSCWPRMAMGPRLQVASS